MTTEPMGYGLLSDIPEPLVEKAQHDMDFALRLLDGDTREAAVREVLPELGDEELEKLLGLLKDIANMSFQDALRALKDSGINGMA